MKIIIFRAKTLLIICLIIGVLLSTLYTPAVQSVDFVDMNVLWDIDTLD